MKNVGVHFSFWFLVANLFIFVGSASAQYAKLSSVVRFCDHAAEKMLSSRTLLSKEESLLSSRTTTSSKELYYARSSCMKDLDGRFQKAISNISLGKSPLTIAEASTDQANFAVVRSGGGKAAPFKTTLGAVSIEPVICQNHRGFNQAATDGAFDVITGAYKTYGVRYNVTKAREMLEEVTIVANMTLFGYAYGELPGCRLSDREDNDDNDSNYSLGNDEAVKYATSEASSTRSLRSSPGFSRLFRLESRAERRRNKRLRKLKNHKRWKRIGKRKLRRRHNSGRGSSVRSLELPVSPICDNATIEITVLAADVTCGFGNPKFVCTDFQIDENPVAPLYTDDLGEQECFATALSDPIDTASNGGGGLLPLEEPINPLGSVLARTELSLNPGETIRFISSVQDVFPCAAGVVSSDATEKVAVLTSTARSGLTMQDFIDQIGIQATPQGQVPLRDTLAGLIDANDNIIMPDNQVIILYEHGLGPSAIANDYNDAVISVQSNCNVLNAENHRKDQYGRNATGSNFTVDDTFPFTDGTRLMASVYQSGPVGGFDSSFFISAAPVHLDQEQFFYSADAVFAAVDDQTEYAALDNVRLMVWPRAVWDGGEPLPENTVHITEPLDFGSVSPTEKPVEFGGISSPNAPGGNFQSLTYRFISGDFTAFNLPPGEYMFALLSGDVLSFELAQSMIEKSGRVLPGDRYFDYDRWFNYQGTLLYEENPEFSGTLALDAYYFTQ